MGYLYVMECKLPAGNSVCKIGISEHDPSIRKRAIQTGCPFEIQRQWQSRNIPDYKQCELQLHHKLSDKQTHGEWFDIDFTKAVVLADKTCRESNSQPMAKHIEMLINRQNDLKKQMNMIEKEIEEIRYELRGCVNAW